MRVLVACEYSGRVREAFRKRGHDAWSCDLLPSEDNSPFHLQCSVIDHDIVKQQWDCLICFPDCTFLTVAANHWADSSWRMEARHWALGFVKTLWALPIKKKALENPIGVLPTMWKRPTQIIHPWQFGEDASKATCLWLENLPQLTPTKIIAPRIVNGKERWANQTDSGQNKLTPSDDRWKERARTYPGIADAMAEQWGN